MTYWYRALFATIFIFTVGSVRAHDPGVTDTVRFAAEPIGVGQSSPVVVSIFNDSSIVSWDAHLVFTGGDSSCVEFDSARYVGRMADPSVEPVRIATPRFSDGISPDSLTLACIMGIGNALPPGDGPVVELYFTGLRVGEVALEVVPTSNLPNGVDFTHPGFHEPGESHEYGPFQIVSSLEVVPPNQPPDLTIASDLPIVSTVIDAVSVDLEASSVKGIPVEVTLQSFTAVDDVSVTPLSTPHLKSGGGYRLVWNPSSNDIGIWRATLVATDSTGLATTAEIEIQIVADEAYLLPLTRVGTAGALFATGMTHGNLDSDPHAELIVAGHPRFYQPSFGTYDFSSGGQLEPLLIDPDDTYTRGLVTAFLNNDPHLDAIVGYGFDLKVLLGRGDGTFDGHAQPIQLIPGSRCATLTDYDGDARLDYVIGGFDLIQLYRQGEDQTFEAALSTIIHDSVLTLNSADLNLDGRDDLAVGTKAGLSILLNDGIGGYEPGESYPQVFGTTDIQVTNQGSDFNGDGLFDLCLATPSVGGTRSNLMVYLGYGDGTFEQTLIRDVWGQVFATRPGDFNGDGYLDIAYINGAEGYLAIIFGDGRGEFVNERHYRVPDISARQLDAVDFDLDGDLDLVVAAYHMTVDVNTGYFVYVNPLDPSGVSPTQLEIQASNNASIELRSPGGGRLSRVVNSLASGELHRRKVDTNSVMDETLVSATVENGRYDLHVNSRPGLPAGAPFSLDYRIAEQSFRLAVDEIAGPDGLIFPIYPAGNSPVTPVSGDFIHTAVPTFTWPTGGVERFELATDAQFVNILESATVGAGIYTISTVLPDTDSALYYWRARPESGNSAAPVYAFNVIHSPTDVDEAEVGGLLPDSCRLAQNFPNPFNPMTTIEYYLPSAAPVSITIHNVLGQMIQTLVSGTMLQGSHLVDWDATDLNGQPVASGIYFYRMEVGEFTSTRKMVLVR